MNYVDGVFDISECVSYEMSILVSLLLITCKQSVPNHQWKRSSSIGCEIIAEFVPISHDLAAYNSFTLNIFALT